MRILALLAVVSLSCTTSCKLQQNDSANQKGLGRFASNLGRTSPDLAKQIGSALKKLFASGNSNEILVLVRKGGKVKAAVIGAFRGQIITSQQKVGSALAELRLAASNLPANKQLTRILAAPVDDLEEALDELLVIADRYYPALPQIAAADTALLKKLQVDLDAEVWLKQLEGISDFERKTALTTKVRQLQNITNNAARRNELHELFVRTSVPLTNKKLAKIPMWKITTPDGGEHFLLGTAHYPFQKKDILAAYPDLDNIMQKSTLFMPENEFVDNASKQLSLQLKDPRIVEIIEGYKGNLRKELGEDYWSKLKSAINLGGDDLSENTHPGRIVDLLSNNSEAVRKFRESSSSANIDIDEMLTRFGRRNNKKITGLEPIDKAIDFMVDIYEGRSVEYLKNLIDNGGERYLQNVEHHMLNSYIEGNLKEASLASELFYPYSARTSLAKRNRIWVEQIISSCKQGEACFIYGGISHCVGGVKDVIELLQSKGYRVTALN